MFIANRHSSGLAPSSPGFSDKCVPGLASLRSGCGISNKAPDNSRDAVLARMLKTPPKRPKAKKKPSPGKAKAKKA